MSTDAKIERRLKAVVFTDIEGFSALTQNSEPDALNTVHVYRDIVTQCTEDYHGELIHFYGDGSLTLHNSAYEAVQCAIAMQQRFKSFSVPVRVGIHLGEVVRSGETVYGNAINIASRIQDLASSASILVSGAVQDQLSNHRDIDLSYVGKESVKNISEPIEVFAVKGHDLLIPTKGEIHSRNKAKRSRPYWVTILAVLVVAAVVAVDRLDVNIFPKPLSEKRILVEIPFVNHTGNPDYDAFTRTSAEYISTCLTTVDELKLVNLRTYYDQNLDKFGAVPLKFLSTATNAEIFVQGNLITDDGGALILNCQLVNDRYKVVESFSEHELRPGHVYEDLNTMAGRIAGFILSSDLPVTTPPNQDAFESYLQAMRLWGENKYDDSRAYLLKAIQSDSTFLDAWYLLIDSYYNIGDFETADSVLKRIPGVIDIDEMNDKQSNDYYYYSALLDHDHLEAYKHLLAKYKQNKRDPFLNSTTAGFAMFFLNAPREALSILRQVKRSDIDYTINSDIYRLTTGIQAYASLDKYNRAANLARRYPDSELELEHQFMQLRAFIGQPDTGAVKNIVTSARLNQSPEELLEIMYWCAKEHARHGDSLQSRTFLEACIALIEDKELFSYALPEILYLNGDIRKGLDKAIPIYEYYPDWSFAVSAVGLGYALLNDQDSARKYIELLDAPTQIAQYPGQQSYEQAKIYANTGDAHAAILQLNAALNEGAGFDVDRFDYDPFLIPLFEDPDYETVTHPLKN